MVKINAEDISRLFSEMNEGPMLGTWPDRKDWLDENFSKSGREFLLEFVHNVLPMSMETAIEDHGLDVPDAFLSVMTAIFVGGVMLGWEMKGQLDSDVRTPFDD